MSYILEALKKLEKERKRGRIPGLSEQDAVVYHSQKRAVWPYLLISVLFLNGVVLLWWFLFGAKDKVLPAVPAVNQEVKSSEIKESGNVISSDAAESSSVSLPSASPPARDTASHGTVQPDRSVPPREVWKTANPTNNEPRAEKEQQKIEALRQEKKAESLADQLPEKKLYSLSELPPSVRESLQNFFTITAYMYSSTPSERKVRINDQMMREGQELEPGIRIEEIVPDGVILTYKKFRFFVSLK